MNTQRGKDISIAADRRQTENKDNNQYLTFKHLSN